MNGGLGLKNGEAFNLALFASLHGGWKEEIFRQNRLLHPSSSPPPPPFEVWKAPDMDCLKLNFDAAFNSITKSCGGGLILRNHLGLPVKIACVFLENVSCPTMAEGLMLRESLLLLKNWGYNNVIVEGDSQSVMQLKPTDSYL
ncbi:uncharacterized protein LOC132267442 [Cornus florida]|uniref:uncharacterized protein LOC132267442 n=1 Tax=Cornus florida TaxID=4283 RepID=UPI0028A05692|nr:uncharacterized protein LOC132267442 [Cornus florida]